MTSVEVVKDLCARLDIAAPADAVAVRNMWADIADLRVQIGEGCEAARNFGAEVPDDEDEPKWVVAAAVIAERNRGEAEIKRLRAALKPFAEPHAMGDNYVQFAPRLILAAREALGHPQQGDG